MNFLFSILLTAIICASASAQTIKTLGFNTSNGVVVADTGTNVLTFKGGANQPYNVARFIEGVWGTGLDIVASDENLNAGYGAPRGSIGVGAGDFYIKYGNDSSEWARPLLVNSDTAGVPLFGGTWLTNTNMANFRTAIGLLNPSNKVTAYYSRGFWDETNDEMAVLAGDGEFIVGTLMVSTNGPTNTTNAAAWITVSSGTNQFFCPLYK